MLWREREPSSSWLPNMQAYGMLRSINIEANLNIADWASGAVSPLTWSPDKTTKLGFSESRILDTNSMVRGSASQCGLDVAVISTSRHVPSPVERCMSETCSTLNLPSLRTWRVGFVMG